MDSVVEICRIMGFVVNYEVCRSWGLPHYIILCRDNLVELTATAKMFSSPKGIH